MQWQEYDSMAEKAQLKTMIPEISNNWFPTKNPMILITDLVGFLGLGLGHSGHLLVSSCSLVKMIH